MNKKLINGCFDEVQAIGQMRERGNITLIDSVVKTLAAVSGSNLLGPSKDRSPH